MQIKRLIGSDNETLSVLERFVAGSLAGVIAQSTIYPMEVIIGLIISCENEHFSEDVNLDLSIYSALLFLLNLLLRF